MAKTRKYPDKKKVKIFRPTKNVEKDDGKFDRFLDEEVPEFLARSSDLVIKPSMDNNTLIWMGRDRNPHEKKKRIIKGSVVEQYSERDHVDASQTSFQSGYSDHQGAGAIDMVVGRCSPYPFSSSSKMGPLFTTVSEEGKEDVENTFLLNSQDPEDSSKHPGLMMDASRIYISQMCDIDDYFNIENSQVAVSGEGHPSSGIMIKSDRVRMHSRRDVKIIAGGDGTSRRDSNGYFIKESPKIHLICGNGNLGAQQPVPLGHNLLRCLRRIYQCQQNILEVVNNLMTGQLALNTVVSNSIRVNPAGPSAPCPVSQAMVTLKNFSDVNDMFNIYFEKFWNIPTDEFGYLNPGNSEFILSRNITIN